MEKYKKCDYTNFLYIIILDIFYCFTFFLSLQNSIHEIKINLLDQEKSSLTHREFFKRQ